MTSQSLKRITVKYEEMENDPDITFRRVISFVNKICGFDEKINETKLKNSMKSTSFENLEKGEKEGKFEENVFNANKTHIKFFFMGPKNKWKNVLPKDIKDKVNDYFKSDLKVLKYKIE